MRSKSLVRSRTSSVARNVVHIAPRLSVSSTPIQRTMTSPGNTAGNKNPSPGNLQIGSPLRTQRPDANPNVRTVRGGGSPVREGDGPMGELARRPQQYRDPDFGARRPPNLRRFPLHRELPRLRSGRRRPDPDRGEHPLGGGRP